MVTAMLSSEEIYEKHVARIKELAAEKNCIVCKFFRTADCIKRRTLRAVKKSCDKWEHYLAAGVGEGEA